MFAGARVRWTGRVTDIRDAGDEIIVTLCHADGAQMELTYPGARRLEIKALRIDDCVDVDAAIRWADDRAVGLDSGTVMPAHTASSQ